MTGAALLILIVFLYPTLDNTKTYFG